MTPIPLPPARTGILLAPVVLGIGVIATLATSVLWPSFLQGRLGYLCTQPAAGAEGYTCARGISYLFPYTIIAMATILVMAVGITFFVWWWRQRSMSSRTLFAAGAFLGPLLIAVVALTGSRRDLSPAGVGLALSLVAASTTLLAARFRSPVIARCLLAAGVAACVVGILVEPGTTAALTWCATVAVVTGMVRSDSREERSQRVERPGHLG